jgi:hypothetical protein
LTTTPRHAERLEPAVALGIELLDEGMHLAGRTSGTHAELAPARYPGLERVEVVDDRRARRDAPDLPQHPMRG